MFMECDTSANAPASLSDTNWPDTAVLSRRISQSYYLPCRAAVEFAAALGLLIVTAPIIGLAALLVRLTSRGPAFYTQTRLGCGGQPYRILKLRSMYHECERHSGPRWSTAGDPRITPIGRFIRRTHIDELPQLLNVLRGQMSLIGPRPERPEFVPQFERMIPRYRERLLVRPGVTGFAQVQLPADTDLESVRRKLAYDLYYIGTANPWLDLRILLSTGLKVCGLSFPTLRKLFGMPTATQVEGQYHRAMLPAETVPEMQLA